MSRYLKTVEEKFQTKLNNISKKENVKLKDKSVFYKETKIFSFNNKKISYGKKRVSPTRKEEIYEKDYKVEILLSHKNLDILGSNLLKPPYGAKVIEGIFKDHLKEIKKITLGGDENNVSKGKIVITKELYDIFTSIYREEGVERNVRVQKRVLPFLKNDTNLKVSKIKENHRDYRLLLKEIVSSGEITSKDIVSLSKDLDPGQDSEIVIRQQIEKQTEWLLSKLREIIDDPKLTKSRAKKYGKDYFNYFKKDINGPEDLMERVFTDYGKNIIFGVPALLNTNSYVISKFSRAQFDLILIDSLSDVEIVELKKPNTNVLNFDRSRNKFYPSKELSVAIGQAERYITAIYKDNDEEFKIGGKKIRDYIEDKVGGVTELSITRPTALIVIGTIDRLVKKYEDLSDNYKKGLSKRDYYNNSEQAYRELKSAYRNVKVTTYTELIEGAQLRLESK